MRRTQVQFDEATYEALKREAHQRGISMSEVLRQLVRDHIRAPQPKKRRSISDFPWISAGRSGQRPGDRLYPISESHDEALAEDFSD